DYIVTCMAEAGFEYEPEPLWADVQDLQEWSDPFMEVRKLREEDPEAFAREYGYGAPTLDYSQAESRRPEPSPGPNEAYRESPSPAAQEEYDKALWGEWEDVEVTPDGATPGPVYPGGCNNEAFEAIYGSPEDEQERFQALYEEWDALYQRIESDPRLAEAVRAWSDCMASAGYPDLEDLYGGENLVYERQSEAYGWDAGEPVVVTAEPEAEPDLDRK